MILAVKHNNFLDVDLSQFLQDSAVVIDVKSLFNKMKLENQGYDVWTL